jgi:adenylosuccinate synthase
MPNIVIAGAQWGDEGKGKIVDLLAQRFQVVARYNGGHNAGHTVIVGGERFVLHLVPSGILHEGVLCVLGSGVVVDPWALEQEMQELRARGVSLEANLVISDRAHLILPHHRALDALGEEQRGARRLGTTGRGIGPAYEDKAARRGLRAGDLLRPAALDERLEEARRHYEQVLRGAGAAPGVDWDALRRELEQFGERLGPRLGDTAALLNRQIAHGYSVLFEGAQAALLDLDHGTYPYVTSSSAGVAGACVGTGVPPARIDGAVGIVKAYTTRVGAGPLPSEIGGELEERVRARGQEYGATTGRPRRCGWFDAVVVRYAAMLNGFDVVALTKLDVLDELDEIRLCTAYRHAGRVLRDFPGDAAVLQECEPVYETLPGWRESTAGARVFSDLPAGAQRYVERVAELSGVEVGLVSTGPERDHTLIRGQSALALWLES